MTKGSNDSSQFSRQRCPDANKEAVGHEQNRTANRKGKSEQMKKGKNGPKKAHNRSVSQLVSHVTPSVASACHTRLGTCSGPRVVRICEVEQVGGGVVVLCVS